MFRKLSIALFFVFLAATGYFMFSDKLSNYFKSRIGRELSNSTNTPLINTRTIELPVAIDDPKVGSVFIHYFFSGKIEKLKKTKEGLEISLDSDNGTIPLFTVVKDTRISRISPPYSASTSQPIASTSLKTGLYVDISTEYDVRSKTWTVHDVFVPTDKN